MMLKDYLPENIYHSEEHVVNFQDAIQGVLTQAQAARDDLLLQLRPTTATWGMALYEKEYGIATDISKPMNQRLSVWRAKRRGQGTTTAELLRLMANSFSGGEVEVTEHTTAYLVEIMFVGTWGVPPNVSDLERSIREMLPAHLNLQFTYRYLTFEKLRAQNITFGELSALGLTFAEFAKGAWVDER